MDLDDLTDPKSALSSSLESLCKRLEDFFSGMFASEQKSDLNSTLYGVYRISSRVKSYDSIVKKMKSGVDTAPPEQQAEVSPFTRWMPDIIGIRIVVLSQRHKLVVQRALDRLASMKLSQYVGTVEGARRPSAQGASYPLWKYFNPPAAYLTSSSYHVRRTSELLDRVAELSHAAADSKADIRPIIKAFQDLSADAPYKLKHKVTGYATLQTVLSANTNVGGDEGERFGTAEVHYEIQLRTLLEDAWAEPEHSMSYKGELDEDTCNLMRNLGAHLHAADDLLQQVVDRWHAVYAPPANLYAQMSLNYQTKYREDPDLDDRRYMAFKRDYDKLYRLSESGKYGDAHKHCDRMLEKYQTSEDSAILSYLPKIKLERALMSLYWRERHVLSEAAATCQDAIETHPANSQLGFWASYRLMQIHVAQIEIEDRPWDAPSPEHLEAMKDAQAVAADLAKRSTTKSFESTWSELQQHHKTRGLKQDVLLWASRVSKKLGRMLDRDDQRQQAMECYKEAIRWANAAVKHANDNPDDKDDTLTTYALNGIAYCKSLIAVSPAHDGKQEVVLEEAASALEKMQGWNDVIKAVKAGTAAPGTVRGMNDRQLLICDTIAEVYNMLAGFKEEETRVRWERGAGNLWGEIFERLVRIDLQGEVDGDMEFFIAVLNRVKGSDEAGQWVRRVWPGAEADAQ